MQSVFKKENLIKSFFVMTFFSLWFISIPLFANDLEDAQSCYVKKDYKSALEKFEKYLSQNKNDITAEEYMKLCRSQLEWEQKKNTTFSEIIKKEELTIAKQEIDELTKRGFEYCQMGKYELALYQFEKIISLDEKNKVAKKYRKYIKQKQEEANKIKEEVLKLKSQSEEMVKQAEMLSVILQAGKELYLKGMYLAALKKFEEVLAKDAQNIIAQDYINLCKENINWEKENRVLEGKIKKQIKKKKLYDEGKKLLEKGNVIAAKESFLVALSLDSQNDLLKEYIALCEKKITKKEEEEKSYIDKLKKDEEFFKILDKAQKIDSLLKKGKELYSEGYFKSALEYFKSIMEIEVSNEMASQYKDLCLKNIGFEEKAEQKILSQSIAQMKEKFKNREREIKNKLANESWQQAIKFYKEEKYVEATDCFEKIKKNKVFEENAQEYIKLCEKNIAIQNENKRKEIIKEQVDLQRKTLIENTVEYFKHIEELINKGKDLYKQKLYEPAMLSFLEVLKIDPSNIVAQEHIKLCENFIRLEKEKKRREVEEIKKSMAEQALKLYEEGRSLFDRSEFEESIKKLTEAWNTYPDSQAAGDIQKLLEKELSIMQKAKQDKNYLENFKEYQRGLALFNDKKWWSAFLMFKKIESISPVFEDVPLYLKLCRENWESEELEELKRMAS